MQNKREKKGISLIVLVITIIVMIILAAAIIISLNNTGIIGNANKAVNETDEKTIQEIANLAWGTSYAEGKRSVTDLETAVKKSLEENNLNTQDYGIYVTESGVDIAKGWLQTKDCKVIKGDNKLEIGDVIYYHDKANNGLEKYTDGWKVLGAENGNLLIVSAKKVDSKEYYTTTSFEKFKEIYQNEVDRLNEECNIYATGTGAKYGRCINIEDINRVTGYNLIYGKGKLYEYGNEITFYWQKGSSYPYYETSNGFKGNLPTEYSRFVWFDDNYEYHVEERPTDQTLEKQKICTIKINYNYHKVVTNPQDKINDSCIVLENEKAYKMLFEDEKRYMLANRIKAYRNGVIMYTIAHTYINTMSSIMFLNSDGTCDLTTYDIAEAVRAVVCLKESVKLTKSSDGGWNISND